MAESQYDFYRNHIDKVRLIEDAPAATDLKSLQNRMNYQSDNSRIETILQEDYDDIILQMRAKKAARKVWAIFYWN